MHENNINQSMHDSIIAYAPTFWTQKRISILDRLLRSANDEYEFDEEKINEFIISESRIFRCSRHTIRKVLDTVNESNIIRIPLPAEKLPYPRPSLLPINPSDYSAAPYIQEIYKTIKQEKQLNLLNIAICLSIESAISDPALTWLLSKLKYEHIDNKESLIISVNSENIKNGAVIYPLPKSTSTKITSLTESTKSKNRHLFLPNTSNLKARKRMIKKELSKSFKKFQNTHFREHKNISWTQFVRVAPLIPVLQGELEPFITTVASTVPGTSAHIGSSSQPIVNSDLLNDDFTHTNKPCSKLMASKVETLPLQPLQTHHDKTDWLPKSRKIINELISGLKAISDKKLNTKNRVVATHQIIDDLLAKASSFAPDTSALHLALNWVKSRLDDKNLSKNPKASSIATDLSRVFTSRLFKHPDSIDMRTWEPVDLELLIYEYLEDPRILDNTRKATSISLKQAFEYGIKNGYFPPVNIPFIRNEVFGGTSRATVIGLFEFDSFITNLLSSGKRDHKIIAISSILGFYGGLRACEVNSLFLDDIIYGVDELIIQIKCGKTQAARRNIPLHLLAPQKYCKLIVDWCKNRKREKNISVNLRKSALFGPENAPDSYKRSDLIDVVISHLKSWFGDDIVFHSLRHSFASWLLIRWYALRYPDITDNLVAKDHLIFSNPCSLKLGQFFSLTHDKLPEIYEPHHLTMISKLMGHLGQKTLFRYYVHTFHIIHRHATNRVQEKLQELI